MFKFDYNYRDDSRSNKRAPSYRAMARLVF